jgi:nickel/cobalt transporter (NicO) family protein
MNARRLVILFAALCPLAGAHRTDEYLQATRLSIDVERVDLEIDLTPGVAMASEVFGWIDTNRDGEISKAEGEDYAQQVLNSVVLSIDGRSVPVKLAQISFPQFRDMSLGVGTIRLRATAKFRAAGTGHHQVSFLNTHRPESSVYLVNALVPATPRIKLADQWRDRSQHGLTMDYAVIADGPSVWTFALIGGLILVLPRLKNWRAPAPPPPTTPCDSRRQMLPR